MVRPTVSIEESIGHCLNCGAQLAPGKDASGKYSWKGVSKCGECGASFTPHEELLAALFDAHDVLRKAYLPRAVGPAKADVLEDAFAAACDTPSSRSRPRYDKAESGMKRPKASVISTGGRPKEAQPVVIEWTL